MRLRAKTQETAHTHQRDTALSDDSTATIKMLDSQCCVDVRLAICVCGVCARADIILTAVGNLLFIYACASFRSLFSLFLLSRAVAALN